MSVGIKEGSLVSVVGAVGRGEAGVGKPISNLDKLVDEEASLNTHDKGKTSLLPMMVNG